MQHTLNKCIENIKQQVKSIDIGVAIQVNNMSEISTNHQMCYTQ